MWRAGAGAVLAAMGSIGWGVVPVLLVRVGLVAIMGAAWFVLAPAAARPAYAPFAWARLIRDSASECLPLSQLGGFVLGARALVIGPPLTWARGRPPARVTGSPARTRGPPAAAARARPAMRIGGAFAAASTVVDVTLELVAQLLYLAGGLALLHAMRPHLPLVHSLFAGTAVLGAGVGAFLLLQRRGATLAERAANQVLRGWPALATAASQALRTLGTIHASRLRLAGGIALHLAAWIGNGLEAWLILLMMGHPVAVPAALAIDSLLYGLRSFAFMVPNALGVQEAGYVLLGGLFGLDMQTCLALSLLRRARDVALGVPALAAWQLTEGRRLARRDVSRKDGARNDLACNDRDGSAAFGDGEAHGVQ